MPHKHLFDQKLHCRQPLHHESTEQQVNPSSHSSRPSQQCPDQSTQDPNKCVVAIDVVANLISRGQDRRFVMDERLRAPSPLPKSELSFPFHLLRFSKFVENSKMNV